MQENLRLLTRILQRSPGLAAVCVPHRETAEEQIRQRNELRAVLSRVADEEFHEKVQSPETIRLVMDQVAEHTLMLPKRYSKHDFCQVTPPAKTMWVEWNEPEWMTVDDGPGKFKTAPNPGKRLFPQMGFYLRTRKVDSEQFPKHPGTVRAVSTFVFVQMGCGNLRGESGILPFELLQLLDADGRVLAWYGLYCKELVIGEDSAIFRAMGESLPLLWFALNAANCKNITYQDVTATCNPRAKWLRRAKVRRLDFRTLKIRGLRDLAIERRPYGLPEESIPQALHWVRGHFKRYTEEAPLLGKHVGTYWWDQHSRGSSDEGIVVKDYQLEVDRGNAS